MQVKVELQMERHSVETKATSDRADRLANLLTLSYEPMLAWSLDGSIEFWNAGAERLYGFAPNEAVGRVSHSLLQTKFPIQFAELRSQLRNEHYWSGELHHICKDGHEVIVDSRMQLLGDDTVLEVNRDITEIKALMTQQATLVRELLAANAKFAAVFNQSGNFAGIMDLEGRLCEVNDLAVNWCGYTRDQVLDRPFSETQWWRGSERVKERIRSAARRAASGQVFREILPYWLADGTERVVDFAMHPIRDESGKVAFLHPTGVDITERKRAEETQQLLMAELNHRVKNTLASVQAIMQQTLRRAKDPPEFVASFTGRVQALSRVHSLLSTTGWQGTNLDALIRDQLLQGAVDESRITACGPPVRLAPQMALHIALMLHELGTNAIKHGALQSAAGKVTISWTVEDAMLRVRWAERGGPTPVAPTKRGFGRTLIEESAKGEGGNAHLSVAVEGIAWNIAVRLSEPITDTAKAFRGDRVGIVPSTGAAPEDASAARLAGKRFIVVEDEPLVALDIVAALENAGAEVVGRSSTTPEALEMIENAALDAALLDANLRGQSVDQIAAALTLRNLPFLFVTGYGRESLPKAFANASMITKPFSWQQLVEGAATIVEQPVVVSRLKK